MDKVKESVRLLPQQFQSSWDAVQAIPLPQQYIEAEQIVVSGMGGSALGGRIIKSLATGQLPIPIDIVTDYDLPEYVDEKTLVIVSSYSGNTEETLSALEQALERKAMIFIITTGGKLQEKANTEGIAAYVFEPEYNPSGQPRMATGYMVGSVFSLLSSLRLLDFSDGEFSAAISQLSDFIEKFEKAGSVASDLAGSINNKIPVLVASGHLLGAIHVLKNQLNETAKSFSAMFDLPELNHHLMEGLVNPEANKSLIFVLTKSKLYHERVQRRFEITTEVLEKNGISYVEYECQGETKFQQVLEILALGSFIQLFLAEKYNVDPVSVPWVDYFKQRLS